MLTYISPCACNHQSAVRAHHARLSDRIDVSARPSDVRVGQLSLHDTAADQSARIGDARLGHANAVASADEAWRSANDEHDQRRPSNARVVCDRYGAGDYRARLPALVVRQMSIHCASVPRVDAGKYSDDRSTCLCRVAVVVVECGRHRWRRGRRRRAAAHHRHRRARGADATQSCGQDGRWRFEAVVGNDCRRFGCIRMLVIRDCTPDLYCAFVQAIRCFKRKQRRRTTLSSIPLQLTIEMVLKKCTICGLALYLVTIWPVKLPYVE